MSRQKKIQNLEFDPVLKKRTEETLKEYEEYSKSIKPTINTIVIGHVDAGKSTLVGHLLFKLGHIANKQMHRLETDSHRSGKASFKFAWAMDETDEERGRGITVDIAKRELETANRQIVILDAPGHVDFIPAVISGAAQAEAAILVVVATRGEFETGFSMGGQTREHTYLARSLGVKSLIVVVNKMDTVDWSWIRFNEIVEQLKPFLKLSSFNLKEDVQFVACSGMTGDHMTDNYFDKIKRESSHPQLEGGGGDWSNIPTLLEALDRLPAPERLVDLPTRVIISDVYRGISSGVFIGAKVISGKLEQRQKLLLLPPNEMVEVKSVDCQSSQVNKDRVERAFAGDIVTATLVGVDLNKFHRGCVLNDPNAPSQVEKRFQARIIMFQGVNTILVEGSPIEVHINGNHESGRISRLMRLLNKSTGELIQRRPRCITKNSSAVIRITLDRVVCCELYEQNKDLGRFMLRCYGKTVAAGLITKFKPRGKK